MFQGRWFIAAVSKAPNRFIQNREDEVRCAMTGLPSNIRTAIDLFMGGAPEVKGNLRMADIEHSSTQMDTTSHLQISMHGALLPSPT